MSLYHEVTEWMYQQQYKHDRGEDYVADTVNRMTNLELLDAISDALDAVLKGYVRVGDDVL